MKMQERSQRHCNTTMAFKLTAPRVEKAPAPMVEIEQQEPAVAEKPRKIVACLTVPGCQVSKETEEEPNYVTDNEEAPPTKPAYNTIARK